MPTRRTSRTLAAALTALALAGCGDDNPVSTAQDAARNAGDQVQQKAIEAATVAALAAIDPELAKDPTRALVQARAVCAAVENKTAAQAAAEARKRFGSSSVQVDHATAKEIVRVLKKDLCPRL
jgi:hypothetical protein